MVCYEDILSRKTKLCLIGLGYVGLPIAVAFSKKIDVLGYDSNSEKIANYIKGIDPTNEIGNKEIKNCSVEFTADETSLQKARFFIVAVPTPVKNDKTPDLSPIEGASAVLGRNLKKGSIVVYESTVYPGVTEQICIPILEKESGLKCGIDFSVGYSPERINPSDKVHTLENIIKVVSALDARSLDTVAKVYELVVNAGVYRAPSIKVAEAAKVIENSQRDINIAFMNELSIIFNKMNIDTLEVLKAAATKWNFLNFRPGLVGGHCIGVDPYYLTYKAAQLGYHSQIILAGRRINDEMGRYVAQNAVKLLIKANKSIKTAKVAILGFTFKENCPDTRNTRVIDIVDELKEYGIEPAICDPIADKNEAFEHYGVMLVDMDALKSFDCVIVAVAHEAFLGLDVGSLLDEDGVIVDIKGIVVHDGTFLYWRL